MQTNTGTGLPKRSGLENSKELPAHPFVESLKPEPDEPAHRVVVLTGLPGKSDRDGYQRLYLSTKLDRYAEWRTKDLAYAETVSPDQSPFDGLEATRASILCDATIYYIWARTSQPIAEFDLAGRLGAGIGLGSMMPSPPVIYPELAFDSLPAIPPLPLAAFGSGLAPGDILWPGQWIASPNGQYRFVYQTDGNIVLYDTSRSWAVQWKSDTMNSGCNGFCIMQGDGNLVLYAPGPDNRWGSPWSSGTAGNRGSSFTVENDGRAVIYSSGGDSIWWRP